MAREQSRPHPGVPGVASNVAAVATGIAALGLSVLSSAGEAPPHGSVSFPPPLPMERLSAAGHDYDTQALQAWDAQAGDWFGYSLAVDGERLVVGIPYDDIAGGNSGSVVAFEFGSEGWRQRDILAPEQGMRGDYFGMAVAIDGTRCVVGAPWNGAVAPQAGAAYVFEWDGEFWYQSARLFAEDGRTGDNFGVSVAVDGDRVLIGSRWSSTRGARTGAAYVFEERAGEWRQSQRLVGSGSQDGDEFGFRLALQGDTIAVGAYAAQEDRGEVYVFDASATRWNESVRLAAPSPVAGDCFGLAVAVYDGNVLVGAPWRDDAGTDSGAAYLFQRGYRAWLLKETWVPPGARGGEYFGCSLSLSADLAVVGARFGGRTEPRSGAAFIASRDGATWGAWSELPRARAVSEDGFGLALALDRNHLIVAAREIDLEGVTTASGLCRWYSVADHR